MSCNEVKEKGCAVNTDPRNIHPNGDYGNAHGCNSCTPVKCKDIQEGEFTFSGPMILLGVCNINKSYLVTRATAGDCEVRAGAIFPDARTSHFPDNASMEFSLAGDYTVKYKWDACCEEEPQFEAVTYPCPCDA